MLFVPKKFKFKKQKKGPLFNVIKKTYPIVKLKYGTLALISTTSGYLTSKHLETLRLHITKRIKKFGKLKINIFPNQAITRKPKEMRMGKGKGNVAFWIKKIGLGIIICEIQTKSLQKAKRALKHAKIYLPINCKIIKD